MIRSASSNRSRSIGASAASIVLVAVIGTFCSCGPSFEPAWRVTDFRLLAIRSDPVTLEPGETATLSALVHAPENDPTYSWSWCPIETSAQQRYECPLDRLGDRSDAGRGGDARAPDGGFADAGGRGSIPVDPAIFELGEGETATLRYPGTRESVYEFCRAVQSALSGARGSELAGTGTVSNCARGYDISVRLVVESGDRRIQAKKKVTLATREGEPNTNPAHEGLEVRVADPSDVAKVHERVESFPPPSVPRQDQWVSVKDGGPDRLVAGVPLQVRADVDSDSAETYQPPTPRGGDEPPEPKRERLSFDWYVTAGDLERNQRVFVPGDNPLDQARQTQWNPPGECGGEGGGCDVKVWSVVRDGRLGVGWASGSFELATGN